MNTDKLIAYRNRQGFNPTQSAWLLAELMEEFTGQNLICALRYHRFLSAYMAEKLQLAA
jgi:hypothetical protein